MLKDIQKDNTIYRVIFEAEPIPVSIRSRIWSYRYNKLRDYYNADLIVDVTKVDQLSKQLYVQSKSYDEFGNW